MAGRNATPARNQTTRLFTIAISRSRNRFISCSKLEVWRRLPGAPLRFCLWIAFTLRPRLGPRSGLSISDFYLLGFPLEACVVKMIQVSRRIQVALPQQRKKLHSIALKFLEHPECLGQFDERETVLLRIPQGLTLGCPDGVINAISLPQGNALLIQMRECSGLCGRPFEVTFYGVGWHDFICRTVLEPRLEYWKLQVGE